MGKGGIVVGRAGKNGLADDEHKHGRDLHAHGYALHSNEMSERVGGAVGGCLTASADTVRLAAVALVSLVSINRAS
jgi:hypothetical protein